MLMNELAKEVGGLSSPSKMPGYAYGIPANECMVGSVLRKKKGSVCHKCYALKGMYVFPVVRNAQRNRLNILRSDIVSWMLAMTELISRKLEKREKVFRWHDSGDLQSIDHLTAIVHIANELPDVKFWLPTRERDMVADWQKMHGAFPRNLIVRVSAAMVGQASTPLAGALTSTVGASEGHACPAYSQGGQCGDCRACWNPDVRNVDYPLH
jgi:hypothetical protein